MTAHLAFVGDVHGNLEALRGLLDALDRRGAPHVIFLGDYINKGARTAEVLDELLRAAEADRVTLLRGNHEAALLGALDTGSLTAFLKMGGAMTIRSYVGARVGPNVLQDFLSRFPRAHLEGIRRMPELYETKALIAQHIPSPLSSPKFRISAHVPVGELPLIEIRSAQLDTGCGGQSGRLTALLWPTLDYIQVDAHGALLTA
ncbi:metallophosphoesterase family protein [Microlunatus lacustris]